MEKMLRDKRVLISFLLPGLLIFSFTVVIPIVWSAYYSFFYWDGISPMRYVGLDNFLKIFRDGYFQRAFANNVWYVLINLVGQVLVGLLVALLLTHVSHGRNFYKTLYFAPAILSSIAVAQVFQKFYSFDPPGLVNTLLSLAGLENLATPWLGTAQTALGSVAVIECYKNMGLYMVIIYSGLMAIPSDVLESAAMDGARGFTLFFKIKMPYIKHVLVVALIMSVNGLLKAFDIPYIATYGGPGDASELVATYMYKTAFNNASYGYGSAIAVFIAVECVAVVGLLRKVFTRAEQLD